MATDIAVIANGRSAMKTLALIVSVTCATACVLLAPPVPVSAGPAAATLAPATAAASKPTRCGCQLPPGVTLEDIQRDIVVAFGAQSDGR
jgi:hypothetical protein